MKTLLLFCTACLMAVFSQAQIIHVPGDYPSIQQGINAATNGDTVLVSDGTYYEQINFLGKKPLVVASKFLIDGDESHIANTIIDGSMITDSINGSIVNFISGEDTTSVLCGFTIRNGNIGTLYNYDGENGRSEDRSGGGIFIFNSGAKIIHNHITENHIVDTGLPGNPINVWGGGVYQGPYVQTEEHWVIVDHNVIDYNSTGCDSRGAIGAGIALESSSIITNNDISYNIATAASTAFSWGGGLVCSNDPSLPSHVEIIAKNNTISNNQIISLSYVAEAAGAVFEHAKCEVSGNIVEYNIVDANSGYTAGMIIMRPQEGTLVSGNLFHGNATTGWQGGLLIWSDYSSIYQDTTTVLVENNYFIGNEARNGGGMMVENTLAILQNNVFAGNHALLHAGALNIYNTLLPVEHMVTIVNNSFSGNKADIAGGAIYSYGDNPLVINSIFYHDSCSVGSGFEMHLYGTYDTVEIANSNIDFNLVNRGVRDGGGNINEDPLFIDQDLLIPNVGSPCIDAGIDTYTCACGVTHICPEYDILDTIRPLGGFDIGAYEWWLGVGIPESDHDLMKADIYPNPTHGIVNCQFSIADSRFVSISIYDQIGREVGKVLEQQLEAGQHILQFDVSKLPAGIYFWRLTVGYKQPLVGKMIRL